MTALAPWIGGQARQLLAQQPTLPVILGAERLWPHDREAIEKAFGPAKAQQMLQRIESRMADNDRFGHLQITSTGGALTLAVPHPIIARRTWLWRADSGTVIEALGFAGAPPDPTGRDWLTELGPVQQHAAGWAPDSPVLGWAATRPLSPAETGRLRETARFAAAPLAALAGRVALSALLEAYLGRRKEQFREEFLLALEMLQVLSGRIRQGHAARDAALTKLGTIRGQAAPKVPGH